MAFEGFFVDEAGDVGADETVFGGGEFGLAASEGGVLAVALLGFVEEDLL